MKRSTLVAASGLALVAALGTTGIALAQTPTPKAVPSVAQLCAATGQEAIDSLLKGVATSDLTGALAPLASIAVPSTTTPTVVGAIQLSDVRTKLNCSAVSTTTATATATATPTMSATATPTATALPTPTINPIPTTPAAADNGVTDAPVGGVETGAGPA